MEKKEAYNHQNNIIALIKHGMKLTQEGVYLSSIKGIEMLIQDNSNLSCLISPDGDFYRLNQSIYSYLEFFNDINDKNVAVLSDIILFILCGKFSAEIWSTEIYDKIDSMHNAKGTFNSALEDFENTFLEKGIKNRIYNETVKKAEMLIEKAIVDSLPDFDAPTSLKFEIISILFEHKCRGAKYLLISAESIILRVESEIKSEDIYGYSVSYGGLSHMQSNVGCDDYSGVKYDEKNGILLGYVADGVGSQSFSRYGSEKAGEAFFETIYNFLKCHKGSIDDYIIEYFNTSFENDLVKAWTEKLNNLVFNELCTEDLMLLKSDGTLQENKQLKKYSVFATTFLAIIKTPKYLLCYKIGDGEFILSDGISENSIFEINDNNVIRDTAGSLHNVINGTKIASKQVFSVNNIKQVILASDGASFLTYKYSKGVPVYRDISTIWEFISYLHQVPFVNKKKMIKDKAEIFACGPGFTGARMDDTSIAYFEFYGKEGEKNA